LIHITRDAGKNWKDVTPKGLTDWSKISLIEASHSDQAVAYAAVDRSRLDDQAPYIFRTRDFGATWQPITNGIAPNAFVRAVREDRKRKGLLFAGTELGVYVSFDDGDHWQPLQLNLPVTSVRDLTVHDDDLIVATHGRSFWILDDINPLREVSDAANASAFFLYHPATAYRIDNDSFQGTPIPPEEPTAENPPSGAVIDYFLKSSAGKVQLEILDAQQNVVRKFSSDDPTPKHPLLPVAERWFSKPETLEKTSGMHRFVWNLTWRSSGGPSVDEEAEYRNPSGPKAIPGAYSVRLTVDGQSQTQPLRLVMDPRSAATAEILQQQFDLAQSIYAGTLEARRVLAEIGSVQKKIADAQQKPGEQNPGVKSALTEAQSEIEQILTNKTGSEQTGLQFAFIGLTSALRVVEGGDRTVPAQAIELYKQSSEQVKSRAADWAAFKQTKLPALNQKLTEANLAPIAISEIEQDVEDLISR
jgi:hypothetical protein